MPKRYYTIKLVAGDEGMVTMCPPSSCVEAEFSTRYALSSRDGAETEDQIRTMIDKRKSAKIALGAACLRQLENMPSGEGWDGFQSGVVLTSEQKDQWADEYHGYAEALGEMIANEFVFSKAATLPGQKMDKPESPEVSGDALNPTP